MNPDAVLMSAYALATQERYDDAERLLESCPEAYQTISGQDLLARIRVAQGQVDQARQIWGRVLEAEPANVEAKSALEALDNQIQSPPDSRRKYLIFGAIAVALGILISIIGALNREPPSIAQEPCAIYVTNVVDRIVTNQIVKTETKVVEVEKPVERIVEHVVTNIVDRTVEVPVVSVVTQYVDRVAEVVVPATNGTCVAVGPVDDPGSALLAETNTSVVVEHENAGDVSLPPKAESVKLVYCPVYVIRPGDQIGRLAQKYRFRMPDFRAVNPDVDPNYVIPGQEVKIPGFFTEEDLPK